MSYGGGDTSGPATRLDFDMNDFFAKDDVLRATTVSRMGLLVCQPNSFYDPSLACLFGKL